MKLLYRIIPPLIILFSLSGCADFFYGNIFSGIDEPEPVSIDVASLGSGDASASISLIMEALEQDSFIEDLSSTDKVEDKSAILSYLSTQYSVTSTDENREIVQSAALSAAEISLKTTTANEAVNNAADMLLELSSKDSTDGEIDEEELIKALLPTDTQPPLGAVAGDTAYETAKDTFAEMIAAMTEANEAYEAFGASLTDTDSDGQVDYQGTENIGVITQAAVVTAVVDAVIDDLVVSQSIETGSDQTNTEQAADIMFDILYGDDVSELWSVTTSNPLESTIENNTSLDNILSASPFDGLFDEFTQEGSV